MKTLNVSVEKSGDAQTAQTVCKNIQKDQKLNTQIIPQNEDNIEITLKEITDLISVRHNDAMAKVEKLAEEHSFGSLRKTRSQYKSGKGRVSYVDTYILNKKQAIAVGAKLNNALLMKVIDRLEELEAKKSQTQIQLPSKLELAQMVIESETKVQQLEHKIEEKDKVILAVADLNIKAGDISVRELSNNLAIDGLGEKNLFKWLKGRNFISHDTQPYRRYVERGYFNWKPYSEKYAGKTRHKLMITPKGAAWIAKMLQAEIELEEEVA